MLGNVTAEGLYHACDKAHLLLEALNVVTISESLCADTLKHY